ncbi:hypothetical protein ACS0TY_003482 [Phlomoides rotata]
MKQVLQKGPQCICLLVKDRNDPSLGLKINATLALSLHSHYHAPTNISNYPGCANLCLILIGFSSATSATNSPDAKVFEDFENSGHKSNPTLPAAATANSTASANDKSDGGKRWLGMVSFLLVTMVVVVVLNLKVKLVV